MLEIGFSQNEKIEDEIVKQLRAAVPPYHADSKSSKAS